MQCYPNNDSGFWVEVVISKNDGCIETTKYRDQVLVAAAMLHHGDVAQRAIYVAATLSEISVRGHRYPPMSSRVLRRIHVMPYAHV
jgi:hypothetical protein